MPVALITGASRGLGRAVAEGLADRGWRLVIDARGDAALQEVRAKLDAVRPGSLSGADASDRIHAYLVDHWELSRLRTLQKSCGRSSSVNLVWLSTDPPPNRRRYGVRGRMDSGVDAGR